MACKTFVRWNDLETLYGYFIIVTSDFGITFSYKYVHDYTWIDHCLMQKIHSTWTSQTQSVVRRLRERGCRHTCRRQTATDGVATSCRRSRCDRSSNRRQLLLQAADAVITRRSGRVHRSRGRTAVPVRRHRVDAPVGRRITIVSRHHDWTISTTKNVEHSRHHHESRRNSSTSGTLYTKSNRLTG